jgi:predicted DNA-binding helix-hairpin-helix protein
MFSRVCKIVGVVLMAVALSHTALPLQIEMPVDLNRASVVELMRVPGITEVWARRIVRFRPYRTKLDLVQEGVVTAEVYRRIRDGVIAHRIAAN